MKLFAHTATPLRRSDVENILRCAIINHIIVSEIPTTGLKVKIQKCHLYTALSVSNSKTVVRLWRAKQPAVCTPDVPSPTQHKHHFSQGAVCGHHKLKLTAWNCRSLTIGEPYIHQLAEDGSNIIVVTEHWLGQYESKQLSEVHPAFTAECSTDARLHENSDLSRGCGGVVCVV